ncbi:metallophosphoesterase [Clostridium sartagoforme AAU1]|uniref:Metallophosphoesterase n=2 Tax=Clostridium sartagoforme TaxID=84031 RepID=R9CDD2_9CLOT|nr:metallophosphoesterase [Clostridium sartagoforme AAU1]
MKVKYILILVLFSLLYFLINYYIGRKILNGFNYIFKISPLVFWIIFWVLALSYIISMFLNKFISPNLTNFLYLIGSYWMGLLMYTLLTFPIIGIINIIISKSHLSNNLTDKYYIYQTILIALVFIIITTIGSFNAKNSYVTSFDIDIDKPSFKEPVNVIMVSDIHLGNIVKNKKLSNMVKEINDLNPDIVIIAGDIIDSDIKPFLNTNMGREFSKIKSTYGTYATLGNHDLMTKAETQIVKILEENSVKVLRDESILINDSIYIIGRDDITINRFSENDRASLLDLTHNLDKSKALIVIDHNPKYINESLNANIDLQLSGHTHKGQIAPGNLVTNKMFEIDYGYLKKDNLNVVVSSGYGTWGPPIRIGSRSEIVQMNLH